MHPTVIFWPMIFLALASLLLYVRLSSARVKTVKEGKVKGSVYRHNVGEPEESLQFNRAIVNQFESPVLFYAVCIAAYASGNVGMVMIILAWAYGISKLVHIYVHITTNNLRHRRPVFMVTYVLLLCLWLVFAAHLLGF